MQPLASSRASMRRAAEHQQTASAASHREQVAAARAADSVRVRLSAEDLTGARLVRTRHGWHEVVRVNRATVQVLAAPGMDDRISVGRVLEVRR
jgi:hypothetical protein